MIEPELEAHRIQYYVFADNIPNGVRPISKSVIGELTLEIDVHALSQEMW